MLISAVVTLACIVCAPLRVRFAVIKAVLRCTAFVLRVHVVREKVSV